MSRKMMPDDERLIELYINEKKSCKEICRMYGMSTNSSGRIGDRLKCLGIEVRKDAGKNHHGWKGGRISKGSNYVGIWMPEHERADNQGYVYEHTLVYENAYGVLPKKGEVIHHIDLDKHNNDIGNLYLCDNKKHLSVHRSIEKLIKPLLENGIVVFDDGEYRLSDSYGGKY